MNKGGKKEELVACLGSGRVYVFSTEHGLVTTNFPKLFFTQRKIEEHRKGKTSKDKSVKQRQKNKQLRSLADRAFTNSRKGLRT